MLEKDYVIKPANSHVYSVLYHILLITNMFRSLLRPLSGQLYRSIKNTTDCQTVSVAPLSVIMHVSNRPYDHKMSAHVLLKSDKTYLLKANITGCIVFFYLFIRSSACSITVSNTTCYCIHTILLLVFTSVCQND